MKKARLDDLLLERGLFSDVEAVKRAVLAREVRVDDTYATSPAQRVAINAVLDVKEPQQFVSRGGLKLRAALDAFSFNPQGMNCADVGCSTGGFTDCLLQAGATRVAAIDVGYGDLAWKLRQDPRVDVFERTNIRTACAQDLGAPFDLIVADLSFIGLAGLAPIFASLCREESSFIGLVKPQFESQIGEVDAHGFVESVAVRERTVHEVSEALRVAGFSVQGVEKSPLRGKQSGNVEYFVWARYEMDTHPAMTSEC